MKRLLCVVSIVIICGMTLVNVFAPDYITKNNSNVVNDKYEKIVEVDMVVYKFWNLTNITKRMAEEHIRINGTFKSMTVRVYLCEKFYKRGYEPYKIKKIEIKE